MKKIYHILLIMLAMSWTIACTEETPFLQQQKMTHPRILDPLFPDRVNGELPVVSNDISRDANFSMTLADSCRFRWPHGFMTEKYRQEEEKKSTSL